MTTSIDRMRVRRRGWVVLLPLVWLVFATNVHAIPSLCAPTTAGNRNQARILVLSAFPAELAPLKAATTVESTVVYDGRTFYLGRLEGVRVALAMVGIGLLNADDTTRIAFKHFRIAGVMFSGVAGSYLRIADVAVPAQWGDDTHPGSVDANVALSALAQRAIPTANAAMETCTLVPPHNQNNTTVCLPFAPAVTIGGFGHSSDPFGDTPVACTPNGGDVFGCEQPAAATRGGVEANIAEDMETAAVAWITQEKKVPFLGIRAVSDGAEDPLGNRGFPFQFFDYYVLAANNAAHTTRAVLAQLNTLGAKTRDARQTCKLLKQRRWDRAAAQILDSAP